MELKMRFAKSQTNENGRADGPQSTSWRNAACPPVYNSRTRSHEQESNQGPERARQGVGPADLDKE